MRACFFTARTGPPGRAVHFREFSASRGGCIRAGSAYLISRDPLTGDLGWQTAYGVAIARVSRRAVPQSDAGRALLPVRGVAGGDRDAEYSDFCTVQAGVRWDGKGRPRLFMHGTSENMQDNRAPCAGCPDWARHTPTFAASLPRRARIRRRGQLWACRRLCERQGCCLSRTMPSTLRPSISRTSSRSKYLLSNKMIRFFSVPMGSGMVFYLRGNT